LFIKPLFWLSQFGLDEGAEELGCWGSSKAAANFSAEAMTRRSDEVNI
jgi:hypothetical protein